MALITDVHAKHRLRSQWKTAWTAVNDGVYLSYVDCQREDPRMVIQEGDSEVWLTRDEWQWVKEQPASSSLSFSRLEARQRYLAYENRVLLQVRPDGSWDCVTVPAALLDH